MADTRRGGPRKLKDRAEWDEFLNRARPPKPDARDRERDQHGRFKSQGSGVRKALQEIRDARA